MTQTSFVRGVMSASSSARSISKVSRIDRPGPDHDAALLQRQPGADVRIRGRSPSTITSSPGAKRLAIARARKRMSTRRRGAEHDLLRAARAIHGRPGRPRLREARRRPLRQSRSSRRSARSWSGDNPRCAPRRSCSTCAPPALSKIAPIAGPGPGTASGRRRDRGCAASSGYSPGRLLFWLRSWLGAW